MSLGPVTVVSTYPTYIVNGFRFQTLSRSQSQATYNCGVCVKGSDTIDDACDYYGELEEIIELEFMGCGSPKIVLFKCLWYDPTLTRGMIVHKKYGLIDINKNRRLNKYDPFCQAVQATHVCYIPYPCANRRRSDWLAVLKVKARGELQFADRILAESVSPALQEDVDELGDDNVRLVVDLSAYDETLYIDPLLIDVEAGLVDIPQLEYEDESEFEHDTTDEEDNI